MRATENCSRARRSPFAAERGPPRSVAEQRDQVRRRPPRHRRGRRATRSRLRPRSPAPRSRASLRRAATDEHRLEQHDPEPLPARGVREHVGALEPVARLDAGPGTSTESASPSRRACAFVCSSSGPQPRIASRASGCAAVTRANASSSVAWSFCAIRRPIASTSGAPAGDSELLGRHLGRGGGQLVEAVVDRLELPCRQPGARRGSGAPPPRSR